LQVGNGLIEFAHARLELVNGVIQRLHLAGGAVEFAGHGFILRGDFLLQAFDGGGHAIGAVGSLFNEVLDHAKARINRGLEALHHVEKLLHLGLQFDNLLRYGVSAHRSQKGDGSHQDYSEKAGGEKAATKRVCDVHGFTWVWQISDKRRQ
jgi:hypothetical protein